jgi:SpoIID/LytB domain protein
MRRGGTAKRAIAAGAASVALIAVWFGPPAAAAKRFVVTGHGNGHGVGMSQWGAYGYAKRGAGYRKIATHYFKGSKVGEVKGGKTIRVLLGSASNAIGFSKTRRACGRDLKPGKRYRAAIAGSRVKLERGNGKRIAKCGKKLVARGAGGKIKIGGAGKFRGDLVAAASGGSLLVINRLPLDDYVAGVIANEMPSSWPIDALRAQALASRSYALATVGHGPFDVYDDTRSQVYGGLASETKRTNRAVSRSRRQVLEYRGDVITAYFSSSSGGRTENVEYGFPGASPKPYLKSVKDPYDGASPDHRWRLSYSRKGAESALSGLLKGRLKGIKVTKHGVSPRIVKAKVLGSGGATKVSGSDLRARFSGRSTWMTFKWKK